jgi:hypothetical protein
VLLEDETRGNLSSGALTLTGISEDRHTLAIEAKDYQRDEAQIVVTGETTMPALLDQVHELHELRWSHALHSPRTPGATQMVTVGRIRLTAPF